MICIEMHQWRLFVGYQVTTVAMAQVSYNAKQPKHWSLSGRVRTMVDGKASGMVRFVIWDCVAADILTRIGRLQNKVWG
jgi:hypothetical protein